MSLSSQPSHKSIEASLVRVANWNAQPAGTHYGTLRPRKTYHCMSTESEPTASPIVCDFRLKRRNRTAVLIEPDNNSDVKNRRSAKWTSPMVFGITFVILAVVALLAIEARLLALQRAQVRADIDHAVLTQTLRSERDRFERRIARYRHSVAVTHSELRSLRADKSSPQCGKQTREADFASAILGGRIEATPHTKAVPSRDPSNLLQASSELGQCWGFQGGRGIAVIELGARMTVTHVAVTHLGRSVAAPRDFNVGGLDGDAYFPLGSFQYELGGPERQEFRTAPDDRAGTFRRLQFEVTSNHGYPSTCVYQLQVYGVPVEGIPMFRGI